MKKEQTFEEIIYDMLLDLTKLECSIPFRTAVDPVTDGCPTYYEIVKEPMDLATLKCNFKDGKYVHINEILAALNKISENCRYFNPKLHPILKKCKQFEDCVKTRWKAIQTKEKLFGSGALNVDQSILEQIENRKQKKKDPALSFQDQVRQRPNVNIGTAEPKFEFKNQIETAVKSLKIETKFQEKKGNHDIFLDDLSPVKNDIPQIPIHHKSAEKKQDPRPDLIESRPPTIQVPAVSQISPLTPVPQTIEPQAKSHVPEIQPIQTESETFAVKATLLKDLIAKPDVQKTPVASEPQFKNEIQKINIQPHQVKKPSYYEFNMVKLDHDDIFKQHSENQKHKVQKARKFIFKVLQGFLTGLQTQKEKLGKIFQGSTFQSITILEESLKIITQPTINPLHDLEAILQVVQMEVMWLQQNLMKLVFQDLQDLYRYCDLVCRTLRVLKLVNRNSDKSKTSVQKSATEEHQSTIEIIQQKQEQFQKELANELKQHLKPVQRQVSQVLEDRRIDNLMQIQVSLPKQHSSMQSDDYDQLNERTFKIFVQSYNDRFKPDSLQQLVNVRRIYELTQDKWKKKPTPVNQEVQIPVFEPFTLFSSETHLPNEVVHNDYMKDDAESEADDNPQQLIYLRSSAEEVSESFYDASDLKAIDCIIARIQEARLDHNPVLC